MDASRFWSLKERIVSFSKIDQIKEIMAEEQYYGLNKRMRKFSFLRLVIDDHKSVRNYLIKKFSFEKYFKVHSYHYLTWFVVRAILHHGIDLTPYKKAHNKNNEPCICEDYDLCEPGICPDCAATRTCQYCGHFLFYKKGIVTDGTCAVESYACRNKDRIKKRWRSWGRQDINKHIIDSADNSLPKSALIDAIRNAR